METADLFPELVQHLAEFFEADLSHVRRDSRVVTAIPGLDSLRLQEALIYLEDRFDVRFDDSVLDNLNTAQDFANHISNLRKARAAAASA